MRFRRRLFAPITALVWLAAASPVAADCDLPGPLPEELAAAEVAFVGTVTRVVGGSARFSVEEIWAGDPVGEVDVVGMGWNAPGRGGPEQGMMLVEDDRIWEVGARYLVIPWVEGGMLRESQCTATTPWSEELEALRPDGARQIEPVEVEAASSLPIMFTAVAALAVLSIGLLAFRRR